MTRFTWLLVVFLFWHAPTVNAANLGPDIYDTKADAKTLIAHALVTAKKEDKHVLLQFGANWCTWCHWLHDLFESDAAIRKKLASSFVLVMIDTNENHNADVNIRYGTPTLRGLPVLVVLDASGQQIYTQETGALEKGGNQKGHDPAKVLAFLNKW